MVRRGAVICGAVYFGNRLSMYLPDPTRTDRRKSDGMTSRK
jgi:hypothetical protein